MISDTARDLKQRLELCVLRFLLSFLYCCKVCLLSRASSTCPSELLVEGSAAPLPRQVTDITKLIQTQPCACVQGRSEMHVLAVHARYCCKMPSCTSYSSCKGV